MHSISSSIAGAALLVATAAPVAAQDLLVKAARIMVADEQRAVLQDGARRDHEKSYLKVWDNVLEIPNKT